MNDRIKIAPAELHIKNGVRESKCLCPIALYLKRLWLKKVHNVQVYANCVAVQRWKGAPKLYYLLSPKLQQWINDYDNGLTVKPIVGYATLTRVFN